jgi:hypothetical protein
MWYKEKHIKEIKESSRRLMERIQRGDRERSREERDILIGLYREELRWIIEQCIEGKIKKKK